MGDHMRNYEEHTMLYNYLINFYIMFVLQFSETRQSVKIESLNIKSALNSLIYRGRIFLQTWYIFWDMQIIYLNSFIFWVVNMYLISDSDYLRCTFKNGICNLQNILFHSIHCIFSQNCNISISQNLIANK